MDHCKVCVVTATVQGQVYSGAFDGTCQGYEREFEHSEAAMQNTVDSVLTHSPQ